MKKTYGVSAVIGVILMVAITVAIAATVYVYVYVQQITENSIEPQIEGTISFKYIDNTKYFFVLDNHTEVQVTYAKYLKYDIGDYYQSWI